MVTLTKRGRITPFSSSLQPLPTPAMLRTCWYVQGRQSTAPKYNISPRLVAAPVSLSSWGPRRSFFSQRALLCAKKEKREPLRFSSPEDMKEQMETAKTEFDSLFSKLEEDVLRQSPRVNNTEPFSELQGDADFDKKMQAQLDELSRKMHDHLETPAQTDANLIDTIRKLLDTGSVPKNMQEDERSGEAEEVDEQQKELLTENRRQERQQLEYHLALDRTDLEKARKLTGADLDALASERRKRIADLLKMDQAILNPLLTTEVALESAAEQPGSLVTLLSARIEKLEEELSRLSGTQEDTAETTEDSPAEVKEELRTLLPEIEKLLESTPSAAEAPAAEATAPPSSSAKVPPEQHPLPHEMLEDRSASALFAQLKPFLSDLMSMKHDTEQDNTQNMEKLRKATQDLSKQDPAAARLFGEMSSAEAAQDAMMNKAFEESMAEEDIEDEEEEAGAAAADEDEDDEDDDEDEDAGDGSSAQQSTAPTTASNQPQGRPDGSSRAQVNPMAPASAAPTPAPAAPLRGTAAAIAYRTDPQVIAQEEADELEEQIRAMGTDEGQEFLRDEAIRLDMRLSRTEGLRNLVAGVPETGDDSAVQSYMFLSNLVDSIDLVGAQEEFSLDGGVEADENDEEAGLDLDEEDDDEDEIEGETDEAAELRQLSEDQKIEEWQAKNAGHPLATAGANMEEFEDNEEFDEDEEAANPEEAANNVVDSDGGPAGGLDNDITLASQETNNAMRTVMPWHLEADEFEHRFVIDVRSHQTITRGGRKQSFSAFVLMGNGNGSAGLGYGRGLEANTATEEAWRDAYKNIITIDRWEGRTIFGEIVASHCKTKVIMRGLPAEGGLRMHDHFRNLCDAFGITDMFCKVIGRRHLPHAYKAIFEALQEQRAPYSLAKAMGKVYFNPNKVVTPVSPYGR